MKKALYLMAVVLLLLTATWETAVSRANPYNYKQVYTDGGEDHPWGGEQNNDGGSGVGTSSISGTYSLTGISAFDMYFFKIYTSWFGPDSYSSTHSTIWWIVPTGSTTTTTDTPSQPDTPTTNTTTTTGSTRTN